MKILFICGPPAAGKTTIGSRLSKHLDIPFLKLDDFTPDGRRLTDKEVDVCVRNLFTHITGAEIVEICYHDYIRLCDEPMFPVFCHGRKIVVTADLETCMARNRRRQSPVQDTYVVRSWHSTAQLWSWCRRYQRNDSILIDTVRYSERVSYERILNFLNLTEGEPDEA